MYSQSTLSFCFSFILYFCLSSAPGNAQPTAELSSEFVNHSNKTILINSSFSEPVHGLDSSDYILSNANISYFDSVAYFDHLKTFGDTLTFTYPQDLEWATNGNLYVANNNYIDIYSKDGGYIKSFYALAKEDSKIRLFPFEYFNDTIFVADYINDRINIFDSNGVFLTSLAITDPAFISVTSNYIYVIDSSKKLHVLKRSGDVVNITGGEGQFTNVIRGICNTGNTIVISESSGAIHFFDQDGMFLKKIILPSQLTDGLIYDGKNYFYALRGYSIIKFDVDGNVLSTGATEYYSKNLALDTFGMIYLCHFTSTGTIQVFTEHTEHYKIKLTPEENTIVSIELPENTVINKLNEGNYTSNKLVFHYDGTPPSVTITSSVPNSTDSYPFIFDLSFSEIVSDLTIDNILIENINNIYNLKFSGTGDKYQLELWPEGNGYYQFWVRDNVVYDGAGHYNSGSDTIGINFETTIPTAHLTNLGYNPGADSLVIDVQFSEPVVGLTAKSFGGNNYGTLTLDVSKSDTIEHLKVKLKPPGDDVAVELFILDSSVYSMARNLNLESNHIQTIFGNTDPILNLSFGSSITNKDTIDILAAWSDLVKGFDVEDIQIRGPGEIIKIELLTDKEYYVKVRIVEEGEISMFVEDSIVSDLSARFNKSSDTLKILIDTTPPEVELILEDKLWTTYDLTIGILLSEPIFSGKINFELYDASLQSLTGNDLEYLANIYVTVNPQGTAKVVIPENSFFDAAGNGNIRSDTLFIRYDKYPLSLEISSEISPYISDSTISEVGVVFKFNETVQEFTEKHFKIYGAKVVSVDSINTFTYNAIVQLPEEDEAVVEIVVNSNTVFNEVGFGNPSGANFFLIKDTTVPQVILTSEEGVEITGPVRIDIHINDPVFNYSNSAIWCTAFDESCFTESDIEITGGYIQNFQGNFENFTFDLIPYNQHIEIKIPENVAYNAVDVGNKQSNILTLNYINGVVSVFEDNAETNEILYWMDSNYLNVDIRQGGNDAEIKVVDILGNIILTDEMTGSRWSKDVSHVKEGIYILIIQMEDNILNTKFLLRQ